jgi:hydrogenase-4 component B
MFGISFLAWPRSQAAADAHEAPMVMLVPQVALAGLCLVLGLFPGVVLRALGGVLRSLPGVDAHVDLAPSAIGMSSALRSFDQVMPVWLGAMVAATLGLATWLTRRRGTRTRRVPTWGCGGELTAQTEYTATAFSKPLLMIFKAVYRPTREVEALAEVSPYFPREVRYRAVIEPTFERYVYRPALRAVLRVAHGMKVLQAGSLHAYLAYVLVLGVLLLLWLGGTT